MQVAAAVTASGKLEDLDDEGLLLPAQIGVIHTSFAKHLVCLYDLPSCPLQTAEIPSYAASSGYEPTCHVDTPF